MSTVRIIAEPGGTRFKYVTPFIGRDENKAANEELKQIIPYQDRAPSFNERPKGWIIDGRHLDLVLRHAHKFFNNPTISHEGSVTSTPTSGTSTSSVEEVIDFQLEYLGAVREKNGEHRASGWMGKVDPLVFGWNVTFPLDVLKEFFNFSDDVIDQANRELEKWQVAAMLEAEEELVKVKAKAGLDYAKANQVKQSQQTGGRVKEILDQFLAQALQGEAQRKRMLRTLSRQFHPDLSDDPDANEIMAEINVLNGKLKDPHTAKRMRLGKQVAAKESPAPKPRRRSRKAATIDKELKAAEQKVQTASLVKSTISVNWQPPSRCGLLKVEGVRNGGRIKVSKILEWNDILSVDGKQVMTSTWSNKVGYVDKHGMAHTGFFVQEYEAIGD